VIRLKLYIYGQLAVTTKPLTHDEAASRLKRWDSVYYKVCRIETESCE
jgi:hypothetical protein